MHYDLLPIKHVKGFLERVKLKKKKEYKKRGKRAGRKNEFFSQAVIIIMSIVQF